MFVYQRVVHGPILFLSLMACHCHGPATEVTLMVAETWIVPLIFNLLRLNEQEDSELTVSRSGCKTALLVDD